MGIRLNWDNVGKGLSAIAQAKETDRAREAYLEGTKETRRVTGGEAPASMMEGIDDVGQLGYDGTGGQARTQYGLSTSPQQWQDTPYTPQQKRMAGLQTMESHYAGRGDTDKAMKYGTAYDQAEMTGLQRDSMKRTATKELAQDGADKEVAALLERSHGMDPESPEYAAVQSQVLSKVTSAFGAVKGAEYAKSQFTLSEAKRVSEIAKREDGWWQAGKSENAAIEKYNKDLPDDHTAKVVVGKNGMRQMVQLNAEGKEVGLLGKPYKSWDEGGREQVLGNITTLAKKEYELGVAHKFKMEEIKAQGKSNAAYAAALRADKKLKMDDSQKEEFAKLDKQAQEAKTGAEMEAATKALHNFANRVAMANGQEPKSWGGLGAGKQEKPAMTLKEFGDLFPPAEGESPIAFRGRYDSFIGTGGGGLVIRGAPPGGKKEKPQAAQSNGGLQVKLRHPRVGVPGEEVLATETLE